MIDNAREIFGIDLSPDNAALLDALGIMTPDQAGRLSIGSPAGSIEAGAMGS